MRKRILAAVSLPFLWVAAHAPAFAAERHPGVYLTPEDVARARENVRRYGWARRTADGIIGEAERWMKRDEAWLRAAVPRAGAAFAYGSTGCPICAGSWGTWGEARASFEDPGHVVCANGHRLPDKDHPDPGTGYTGKDGRIRYFVGSYNAWVVETLTFRAAGNLAYAYSLTGEERYAARAAVILDALAAVYPECDKGSWDYPSNPPSGRFNRPWYQVARVLVHYVDFYDQIRAAKALDEPSVRPGFTRRRNIEQNLMRDAADYCFRESQKGGLTNGMADYIRGALAVGLLLDIPEYIKWAVDGPYGIHSLLENNIDRDGGYFETSTLYASHTRSLYSSFLEPLRNFGVDLYKNAWARRFYELHSLAQECAGHSPRYGDSGPDTRKASAQARPFNREDYEYLQRLYARTTDAPEARSLAGTIRWLANGREEELRVLDNPRRDAMSGHFEESRWMLFHGRDLPNVPAALSADSRRRLLSSHFMGQKGIVVLRAGEGEASQAVLLRYGPSLTHGQFDDLNINYFARGYEVTYDLGYGNAATHTQVGWAKQTASHNLVIVDEKPQLQKSGSGGSLHLFAGTPLVKLAEASSEASYASAGVSLYRRVVALIGKGPDAYLLDIFRVRGGSQHDYGFHSLGGSPAFSGMTMGPEEPGSLAGPEIDWGERQLNDGYLSGVPQRPYWIPPPGNGFGFLVHPRRTRTDNGWSATWQADVDTRIGLHMPSAAGTEVITATAPGIVASQPKANYVFARRRGEAGLASEFVAAIEPHGAAPVIRSMERLAVEGPDSAVPAVAVRIERKDGATDYVFSSGDAERRQAGGMTFAGRFAYVRTVGGKAVAVSLAGAKEFSGFGVRIAPPRDAWRGAVSKVEEDSVTTSTPLATDGSLNGAFIVFGNARYSRTTAWRIERVTASGAMRRIHLGKPVTLGRGQVGKIVDAQTLTTVIPHGYARTVTGNDSGFFTGKRICTQAGACTTVRGFVQGVLTVDDSSAFRPGDVFRYYDLQAGDTFEIPVVWAREYR